MTHILNLQQDHDVEYWGIDLKSITRRCHELDVRHMRRPDKPQFCGLSCVEFVDFINIFHTYSYKLYVFVFPSKLCFMV
ncbi:hypothetical protein AHAS_Ahas03G0112100 [Arachis hypogaea]